MGSANQALSNVSIVSSGAANDAVFSSITRDEALRIIKNHTHSLAATLIQPFRNVVSGWLGLEFWPNNAEWSKAVQARHAYNLGVMSHIPDSVANDASLDRPAANSNSYSQAA